MIDRARCRADCPVPVSHASDTCAFARQSALRRNPTGTDGKTYSPPWNTRRSARFRTEWGSSANGNPAALPDINVPAQNFERRVWFTLEMVGTFCWMRNWGQFPPIHPPESPPGEHCEEQRLAFEQPMPAGLAFFADASPPPLAPRFPAQIVQLGRAIQKLYAIRNVPTR